jgi:hypothetical protein
MKMPLLIASLSIVLVLVLAACGSSAASTADPVTVLEDYYAALTAGDLEKAMSFVAADAIFGGKWEPTNIKDTNGKGRLVYDFKAYINDVPVYTGTGLTIVKNGKIIFDGAEFYWKGECEREPSQSFCSD